MTYDHSSEFESDNTMGQSNSNGPSPSRNGGHSKPPKPVATPAIHRCSYCGQNFDRAEESRFMPFCSKRCQHIDLGMWLNESYRLPCEGESSLDSYGIEDDEEQ